MKSGQRRAGFAWALGLLTLGLAAGLPAEGLYVLGGLGGKSVYDTGVSDYYGVPGWNTPGTGLFDGSVAVGWRFPRFIAVEGSVTGDGSQSYSADNIALAPPNQAVFGNSTLTLNPMATFAVGPVFYWEHPSWWFGETESLEFGLKLEVSSITGSDSFDDYGGGSGTLNFSGQTFGVGVFLRDLEIWTPGGFSLGAEVGWDDSYFSTLNITGAGGDFGGSGTLTSPYTGNNAAFDNSGGYFRIVFGWTQNPRRYLPPRPLYRRRWRRPGYYYYGGYPYGGYGEPDDGQPGDTVPAQPGSQPAPQAAPQGTQGQPSAQPGDTIPSQPQDQPNPDQTYPDDRNEGN